MISDNDMDDDLRVSRSVRYFLNEHGDNAVVEAQAALRYAEDVKDQGTVDVFKAVLQQLAKQHSK